MARKLRIEFPGALYHVVARGNRRNRIFLTPKDYERYLLLIKRYKKRYDFQLYAYALMSNHLHLLVETSTTPLSSIMQGLQQTYTQFFNLKYGKVGHLFQGRYKAILCQKDVYLLELIRYIHLNPIRAAVAQSLATYPWTSYSYYLKDMRDNLVDTDFVLRQFGQDRKTARRYYQQFIRVGLIQSHEAFLDEIVDQRILGTPDFVEKVLQHGNEVRHDRYIMPEKLELKKILETICLSTGTMPVMVKSNVKIGDVVAARRLFIYIARVFFGYQAREIALFLGLEMNTVLKNFRHIADRVYKEKRLGDEIEWMLDQVGLDRKDINNVKPDPRG